MKLMHVIRVIRFFDTSLDRTEKGIIWLIGLICSLVLIYNLIEKAT